jgi:hypothetical protein
MYSLPVQSDSEESGFFVDVGEKDLFHVEMEDSVGYQEIHRSQHSTLVVSTSYRGERTTIRVSWSKYKRVAQGKGYMGMTVCGSLPYVPEAYSRELCIVGSTYLEISTRQYVDGYPLSEVWSSMSNVSKQKIMSQIENVVHDMSAYTSDIFMRLQGKNLSTSSPVDFINYRIVLSMITNDLEKGDMRTLDMEDFKHVAVLCHNNLSMDHVIVLEDSIVGVVGWSKCDFVPEVMSRMHYQFCRPVLEGESEWYAAMSRMDLFHPAPPVLYTTCCMYYNYYIRLKSTPGHYHEYLQGRLSEMSDAIMPSVRETYMGVDLSAQPGKGDRGSLLPHAEKDDTDSLCETDVSTVQENVFDTPSTQSWEFSDDECTILDLLDSMSVV